MKFKNLYENSIISFSISGLNSPLRDYVAEQ